MYSTKHSTVPALGRTMSVIPNSTLALRTVNSIVRSTSHLMALPVNVVVPNEFGVLRHRILVNVNSADPPAQSG